MKAVLSRRCACLETIYQNFPLRNEFVEVERQIIREETVAQVSFKSTSLQIMLKLFISEMEGEGGIYLAPLGTLTGYREQSGWMEDWTVASKLSENPQHDRTPLDSLSGLPFPQGHPQEQLRAALEWFNLNIGLIVEFVNSRAIR